MFSVMWSEHCSYKSSRIHLGRLPTEAPWVHGRSGRERRRGRRRRRHRRGACASRATTTRPPSSPTRARPPASAASSATSSPWGPGPSPSWTRSASARSTTPASRWIAEGVVSGISGYGNSVGVPTVGGEVVFDETYQDNPLVNVFCLGILPHDRLVLGQASGVGNLAVLLGSSTGRDGIGGVSVLASAGFGDDAADADKRPSVQVGDPFEEKRLIEACLALLDAGLVVGIQDLGGAGLTCATSETASRGGVGMDVDVTRHPAARVRHGAVRGAHVGVPGADARHRHPRRPRRGARHLPPLGGHRLGHRHRHRRHRPAHPRRPGHRRAPCSARCRRRRCTRTRRSTTGPDAPPEPGDATAGEALPAARPTPAPTCSVCCSTRRGCGRSTTTSSS